MRILIVDDDKHMRRLVKAMLESEGMECHEAEDGHEALTKARDLHPSVIVLDVMLPGLDGYMISRMLKFDENFADIGIVMLTSRSKPSDRRTGLMTGADVYLTKPFNREDLVSAVRQVAGSTSSEETEQRQH